MSANLEKELELEEEEEFKRYSDVVERIASKTIPGRDNSAIVNSLGDASGVVDSVLEDLNNWVEIVDVRVFRGNVIGIPMRYRWTIKRWSSSDMDKWLLDNGWDKLAHLKADSKEHKDNEMEARYYKEIDGWDVFVNIYVEFTNDVFKALEENSNKVTGLGDGKQDKTEDHLEALKRMRRSQ
jgi:hypothetical protein